MDAAHLVTTYGLIGLGAIIFAEMAFLVGVVLPGETSLVLAGIFSRGHAGPVHFHLLSVVLVAALTSIAGAQLGYGIGWVVGPPLFHRPEARIFKRRYADLTIDYFERYGSVTVLLARFVPVVRSFTAPAAGVGKMAPRPFTAYNVAGGAIWAASIPALGYALAAVLPVRHHLIVVTLAIAAVSLIPLAHTARKARAAQRRVA